VTFDAYAYLDAAAAAVDLRVSPDSRDAVAASLVRLEALARQLIASDMTTKAALDERGEA
jgi:hypothetical protein